MEGELKKGLLAPYPWGALVLTLPTFPRWRGPVGLGTLIRLPAFAFAVEDPYKNIVRLERGTWEKHIILRHPEVSGTSVETLRRLIESPDRIRRSTQADDMVAFEDGTLRAFVVYDDADFTTGETFGRVSTVYPDTGTPSTVGPVIYEKKGGTQE